MNAAPDEVPAEARVIATLVATPALSEKEEETTPANGDEEKANLKEPAVPTSDKFVKVATPSTASTESVPLSVPAELKLSRAAVTVAALATVFPFESTTVTIGCVENPFVFVASTGCVETTKWCSTPARSVNPDTDADVTPSALNVKV